MSSTMIDQEQYKHMQEECILVSSEDEYIGKATKEQCHKWNNIESGGYLHRAFSVFLFNKKNELLLQQRSSRKPTFPGVWTNTCCSHPLHIEQELESRDALGVKKAARRKLNHELGISEDSVPLESFDFMTRILYKARWNRDWGEHELDYLLILKSATVLLSPNKNEVEAIRYVDQGTLKALLEQSKRSSEIHFSPWFLLIAEKFLFEWWDNLNNINWNKDMNIIHNMISCEAKSPVS